MTYSKKEANSLKTQLDKFNQKDFVIFNPSDSPTETEYYYLPKLALNYANNLIANSKEKLSVLFCFDDLHSYILKDKNISNTAKSYVLNLLTIVYI
jgi:hypothetical protein